MKQPDPAARRLRGVDRRRFLGLASGCLLVTGVAANAAGSGLRPVDVGTVGDFPEDVISEQFSRHNFFVVRHGEKLFAVIATCPHKGNYLVRDSKNPKRIVCTGHDAVFDPSGTPVSGRVRQGLERFGIELNQAGRILVDPNRRFPKNQWEDKGAYLTFAAAPAKEPKDP